MTTHAYYCTRCDLHIQQTLEGSNAPQTIRCISCNRNIPVDQSPKPVQEVIEPQTKPTSTPKKVRKKKTTKKRTKTNDKKLK